MKKILTIVGARPQFIKAATLSRIIQNNNDEMLEVIVHTGQHFDGNMSQVFFDELDIPRPKYNLEISGGSHGEMTGRMLEAIERVLLDERPEWVVVYGDTNSTLAGALAAAKLHIPIAHVEAGLRSFNMRMPEEVNRILADRVSSLLFCPTDTAVKNLSNEGITDGVHNVGDVMYDAAKFYRERAGQQSGILHSLGIQAKEFALATCHRAENTDVRERLAEILEALAKVSRELPVVFPLHPRTAKLIEKYGLASLLEGLKVTEPLSFLDMVALEQAAAVILTDSGGVQKEAFFYGVPCITMREETEWVETVELGLNCLCGASAEKIFTAFRYCVSTGKSGMTNRSPAFQSPYGDGCAAQKIIKKLL